MVRCSSAVAERSSGAGTNAVMVSIAPPHLEEHRGYCWGAGWHPLYRVMEVMAACLRSRVCDTAQ